MALADELLDSISEEQFAEYMLVEENPHIVIDEDRNIILPERYKIIAAQGDHDMTTYTFDCPRFSDGRDMSKMVVYINYIRSDGETGSYPADNVSIDAQDNNLMHFEWTPLLPATLEHGAFAFLVCVCRTEPDGNMKNHWSTRLCKDATISEGMDCHQNTIIDMYPDVITRILERLNVLEDGRTTSVQYTVQDLEEEQKVQARKNIEAADAKEVSKLSEEIEEQKEVPMASINPYKMNLKNYDVVINEGRYVTGYSTSTLKPTVTQNNTYDYDVIDMAIKHDNCILTVPYDPTQNVGQAFVLYTEGIQANNATPNNVNNKQVGVIEVSADSYTVNLNASKLNYERVAFTVPKGRRDFYLKNIDDGELGKLIDEKISNTIVVAPVNMFYSIGAIGDSYTAGSALSSDGVTWQDVTELSWIATMAKRAGIYYSNYGKGGATTKSYITDKLPSVLSGQAKDLYFICLGINDYMQNISVGAISDIKNDYTQNGESFYGYYGSIIAQVQAHAPKAKIVLVKIWTDGTSKIPYNNAITEIASHFGLPVIDPFDDIYFNSSLYLDNMVSGHPTAMGYACMGLAMERLFSKCVIENSAYFKFATIG